MTPIARPLPHAGRMYQSFIFISFFMFVLGVCGLYFFMWLILLRFVLIYCYGIK